MDGIDTRVEEVASNADEAVKTASQVSQRVDSLSSTITQVSNKADALADSLDIMNPGFESGDLTGWTTSNYKEVRVNTVTPRSGVYKFLGRTAGNSVSCGLLNDSVIPVVEGQRYRIEADLSPDSGIEAGSIGFGYADQNGTITSPAKPTFSTGYWNHCSGEFTIPSGVTSIRVRIGCWSKNADQWLRIDNVKITNVTDIKTATDTANSALSKSSSVEQNLNSFKTSVSQTYETKSDALNKQSSLQQSVNNLRTEVSETYTTKTEFTNLNNAATKTYQFHANNNQTGWYKLGTWSNTQQSDVCAITIYAGNGQNGRTDQNREVRVFIKDGFQSTASASGAFGVTIDRIRNADNAEVQVRATAANSCDVWYKGDTHYAAGRYTISIDPGSKWTHSGSFTTSAPSSGTLQSQEYQTYSTKSYVDQTSRTVSLGVVEEYKNGQHGSALATQSDITATKDSITSTVSKTYLSKTDASNTYLNKNTAASTYATKTEVKQTSDSLTVTISSAVSKAESAATAASNAQNTANTAKNNAATAQSTANTAKTNAAAAQSTANTANTNATNANNRVGNLETCIKMTSDGVRVGKISNGNFTGYSALVNSAGSFDVLDSSGNAVSRFTASSIELGKNSKTSTVSMCGGVVKFSSNSGGTNLAIDTQNKGPIVINSRQLGMFGRACQFGSSSHFRTTAANQWVKATLTPHYINSDGVTETNVEPFASVDGGVKFNVSGLYLISISTYARDVAHLDVCHLGLMNAAGTIQMEQQVCAGGNWDGITHTECRTVTAGTTLWMVYKCENAGGSSMDHPFMTCAFLSYVN